MISPLDKPRQAAINGLAIHRGPQCLWSVERATSPLIGTAIHNGHGLRDEVGGVMALDDAQRLREEDPFTEYTIRDVPNRVVFHRSRFEIDLNRAADGAVYLTPEQAWGLNVWAGAPAQELVQRSLDIHAGYYVMLQQMLAGIEAEFGRFVHANFPKSGCAIAIEFKKFFMDEWTGEPDADALELMRRMIRESLPVLLDSLRASA